MRKRKMIKKLIVIILILLGIFYMGKKAWAGYRLMAIENKTITFTDENLYRNIKSELGNSVIESNDGAKSITVESSAIDGKTELDLNNRGISDLSGLDEFTALRTLNLSKNSISDITPISNLNSLTNLNLSDNSINNINGLTNLRSITTLNLSSNSISDIQPIKNYTSLVDLNISSNRLSSIGNTLTGMSTLKKLNISNNSSFANLDEVLLPNLTSLSVADTAVTNIENIISSANLEELDLGNDSVISLAPIFYTYDRSSNIILSKLKKLDLEHTTKAGLSFTNLKKLPVLEELYLQNNGLSSVSGIAEITTLKYVNLDDNEISNINDFVTSKYTISAKQISMQNNLISDISVFNDLHDIEYLNLAQNKIENIEPIEHFDFQPGRLSLQNQDIKMDIYQKKNNDDHYIILYDIFQSAKDSSSEIYDSGAQFITQNVTLNSGEKYNAVPNYNVIIDHSRTNDDTMSVTLQGGIASGTKITFKLSSSSSAVETLKFEDENLDNAIYGFLRGKLAKTSYIARAPNIINISQREISNTTELGLANGGIQNIKGLSNFSNLKILNLANNQISDDSEIIYLTKLENLNLANNRLNNKYTSIENLYSLQNLNIEGNNVSDLNSLSKLLQNIKDNKKTCKLTELSLAHNNLTNIDATLDFSTLENLNVSNNSLTSIDPIKNNISMNILNISGNDIENIDILRSLTSLRTLYMAENIINDITPISNLSLTTLDISGNIIKNINSLSNMVNLTDLYINNNLIEDVTPIEGLLIKNTFEAKQQKIVKPLTEEDSDQITVTLPKIFESAKNSGSKVYTQSEFSVTNCTLGEDGNSIKVNTNELKEGKIASISIIGGAADRTTFSIATDLIAKIDYDIKEQTKQNVTATISFSRNNIKILNNGGKTTHVFEKNGNFTFVYQDEYGFTGDSTATVTWIDNEGPQATVEYSNQELTNQDVKVTVKANEKITNTIEGWTFENDEHTQMSKTYGENIEETLTLKDQYDNVSNNTIIKIENIDKDPPVVTGVQNGRVYKKSARAKVEDKNLESITLTKDGSPVTNYKNNTTISGNGSYVLVATDGATNKTTVNFRISDDGIDDTILSNSYTIDANTFIISEVMPDTTVQTFKSNIQATLGYKVVNNNNQELSNSDLVGTGCKIVTEIQTEYPIAVKGDISGDGKISLADVTKVRKHILKLELLENEYKKAADVNKSNSETISDVTKIRKVLLKLENF